MELLFERKKFPKAPDGDRYEWIETETQFRISQKSRVLIKIAASARNAAQNHSTDDDDLRVALNGYEFGKYEIHDEKVSWKGFGTASSWNGASLKGMNKTIYFSGDLAKGTPETLKLEPADFEFLEDSVELWIDETPITTIEFSLFDRFDEWLEKGITQKVKLRFYEDVLVGLILLSHLSSYDHARRFLKHSLSNNPQKLKFGDDSDLAIEIKKDKAYLQVVSLVKGQIKHGVLNGQIHLGDEGQGLKIDFEKGDLKFSLHGLRKVEFVAKVKGNQRYDVEILLFDVYDFDPQKYHVDQTWIPVNMADVLEKHLILKNFEVEIKLFDTLTIGNE